MDLKFSDGYPYGHFSKTRGGCQCFFGEMRQKSCAGGGGFSWGNLFEEKVPPDPFQNLFNLLQPVCLADMVGKGAF